MEQHPGRQRSHATPIIAKGYVYPLAENHGSISKKYAIRIDFVRVCQKKAIRKSEWLFSQPVEKVTIYGGFFALDMV